MASRCRLGATLLPLVGGLGLACATHVTLPPLPECHPASDAASSARFARPSGVLDSTAPVPTTQPSAMSGHEHQRETMTEHEAPVYSCPMHPEVRSGEPGSCPVCGMLLEAVEPEPEVAEEQVDEGHGHHHDPPGGER